MSDLKNYFNGFKQAQPFGKGRYFVPGHYDVEVEALNVKTSQNPDKRGAAQLIAEFKVHAFDGVEYTSADGSKRDTRGEYKAGSTVSTVINLDDPRYGQRNAKELLAPILAAVTGQLLDKVVDEMDDEDAAALVAPDQPGKGARLHVECWNVVTKKGADFSATRYAPANQSAADAA